jgi:hypothetical protein
MSQQPISKLVPVLGHPQIKVDLVNMKPWRVGKEGVQIDMGPFTWTKLKRLTEGRNTMTAFVGPPRSGKSDESSADGENSSQNKPFRARDITFLPQDYMRALGRSTVGDQVNFDEPGAEYGNRSFATVSNKMLNATHVTFGSKLISVDWAVPVLKMQDLQSRMLVNFVFMLKDSGMRGFSKLNKNWVNGYTGKAGRTGLGYCWWAQAWAGRPEEKKEYVEMKDQYQDSRNEKHYKEFSKADDEHKDKVDTAMANIAKALAAVRLDAEPYKNSRGNLDANTLHHDFHLTMQDARYVVTAFLREESKKEKTPS